MTNAQYISWDTLPSYATFEAGTSPERHGSSSHRWLDYASIQLLRLIHKNFEESLYWFNRNDLYDPFTKGQ